MMKKRWLVGMLFMAMICELFSLSKASSMERFFNVRDSIEMSHFSTEPKLGAHLLVRFSPEGRYFAVVTSRGLLQSDMVESTILVFSTSEVRAFLRGRGAVRMPEPHVVARISVVPQGDSELIIGDLRWLSNSKGIVFQAQNGAYTGIRDVRSRALGYNPFAGVIMSCLSIL